LNPLPEILRALGLDSAWGYLGLFLAASLLMGWLRGIPAGRLG